MEILNNFASIYCFITFIIGAGFMLTIYVIEAMGKEKEPRNNIHFYVARDKNGFLYLYFGKPIRIGTRFLCSKEQSLLHTGNNLSRFGLNDKDYANLKWEDEPVEVFLNLKD